MSSEAEGDQGEESMVTRSLLIARFIVIMKMILNIVAEKENKAPPKDCDSNELFFKIFDAFVGTGCVEGVKLPPELEQQAEQFVLSYAERETKEKEQ